MIQSRMGWGRVIAVSVSFSALAGCDLPPKAGNPGTMYFSDLRVGVTTRDEVTQRLGEPRHSFEDERLLSYIVDLGDGLLMRRGRTFLQRGRIIDVAIYHLTVQFDGGGTLHSCDLISPGDYRAPRKQIARCK